MTRALPVAMLALLASGCPKSSTPIDAGPPPDAGPPDAGPLPPPADELALLFVMDDSNSNASEQGALLAALPGFYEALATGDRDGDGAPDFEPFAQVRVGVVTSDMGTGGFIVPTCVDPDFGKDGILRTEGGPNHPDCDESYPSVLAFDPASDDLAGFTMASQCVANVGTGGCGFEQPLEAGLKALSPSAPQPWTAPGYVAPSFFMGTAGHGDGANAGLIEGDELLAIVVMQTEDDCSARDPEVYDPLSERYGGGDLSRRCDDNEEEALHPIARFVDGLLQLRPHPDRLAYLFVGGLPVDLQPAPGARPDYVALVSEDPSLRDDRMEQRRDPEQPTRLLPACSDPSLGVSYPGVRLVKVAEGLDARGARASVASICQTDQSATFEILLSLLRP